MTQNPFSQMQEQAAAPLEDEAAQADKADNVAPAIDTSLFEAQIATLKDELQQAKDSALRAMAETENVRRRTAREREDTAKYAVSAMAKDLLAVADNFRRALEAVPPEARTASDAIKNLIIGIEATERQLLSAFERAGIKSISPLGQPFDPNFHRVMLEVEQSGKPAGTVVQVLQNGYVIHDRLLREAMVAVAKNDGDNVHKLDTKA